MFKRERERGEDGVNLQRCMGDTKHTRRDCVLHCPQANVYHLRKRRMGRPQRSTTRNKLFVCSFTHVKLTKRAAECLSGGGGKRMPGLANKACECLTGKAISGARNVYHQDQAEKDVQRLQEGHLSCVNGR